MTNEAIPVTFYFQDTQQYILVRVDKPIIYLKRTSTLSRSCIHKTSTLLKADISADKQQRGNIASPWWCTTKKEYID